MYRRELGAQASPMDGPFREFGSAGAGSRNGHRGPAPPHAEVAGHGARWRRRPPGTSPGPLDWLPGMVGGPLKSPPPEDALAPGANKKVGVDGSYVGGGETGRLLPLATESEDRHEPPASAHYTA